MKTEPSNRYVLIDDFLTGELRRWKERQAVNEISAGDSYVHVYKGADDKIVQQSKDLGGVAIEKVFLVCTRVNGHAVVKYMLTKIFKSDGINAHSFRHTRHHVDRERSHSTRSSRPSWSF